MGMAYFSLGRSAEAIKCYEDALDIDSSYSEAQLNLGVVLRCCGRKEEALGWFRKAVDNAPMDAVFL
jgi:tetratricopeptide (TPR) repeat protein